MKYIIHIISVFLMATVLASCTDNETMRQRLSYVSQCNRADTVFTEAWLPTVDSLVSYFDRHGNANEKMMAHYLKGRVHHDMGESPIALECYQKATEMADTTKKDCYLYTLYAIYGQMALLFDYQYLPDDEMKALEISEKIAWKDKDTLAAITAYRLKTRVYYLRNDTDSMLYVTNKSFNLYRKCGENAIAAQILIIPISVCLNRGQYKDAWKYMQVYEKESGFYDSNDKAISGKELYYYYKGMYLLSQNQPENAILLFQKALSGGFLEAGYKGLLSAYEQKRNPDSIVKYARLYANGNDSTFMHVNQNLVHQISAQYNYSRQQRIAEQKAREAAYAWRLLFFVTLILVVFTLLFARKWNKTKNKIIYTTKLLLEKVEENKRKDKKIKLLQTANDKKDLCLQLFSTAELETEFKNSTIFKDFYERKDGKLMPHELTEKDWKELTDSFRTHFVNYYTFIAIDNKLPINQFRYCMLVRLGFTGQEIGVIMDKDKDQRYHLRKFVCKNLFNSSVDVKSLEMKLRKHF
ncbi:MAG: hypothetical protein IJL54_11075 [Prevotella sp.]|nr:hypothetical protein [Prevotella sp.]